MASIIGIILQWIIIIGVFVWFASEGLIWVLFVVLVVLFFVWPSLTQGSSSDSAPSTRGRAHGEPSGYRDNHDDDGDGGDGG